MKPIPPKPILPRYPRTTARQLPPGYERLQSPTIYELPLENYDGTKGGYHNPD
ncbi:hypothetical protein L4X63_21850 [Geomonas sp. Red32]|uniref:hypothetical protein n=1 Tax=Geomonas sp. Red32 TaxID=2912856 RepID=UPI00202CFCFD|nr:hypothetical protein [Geomonas sp. Red32]MCM0084231.1 hypothetical protein [Geomonas sp. Red32]